MKRAAKRNVARKFVEPARMKNCQILKSEKFWLNA